MKYYNTTYPLYLYLFFRDVPVCVAAPPWLPLQPDVLSQRAAGGAPQLLLWVQTQEGFPARRPPRTFWILQHGGSLALLQVRYSNSRILKVCVTVWEWSGHFESKYVILSVRKCIFKPNSFFLAPLSEFVNKTPIMMKSQWYTFNVCSLIRSQGYSMWGLFHFPGVS